MFRRCSLLLLSVAASFLLTANAQTCSELIAADPDLTTLNSVLVDSLGGSIDVADTVLFAPVDSAFDFMDNEDATLERITTNALFVPQLRQLILQHAVAGMDTAVVEDGIVTLTGETLGVAVADGGSSITITGFAGDAISVLETVEGTDCVIHKVDGIITPNWWEVSLIDLAASGDVDGLGTLTTVFNQLDAATLQLASTVAALTVFAPSDDAFAKLGDATISMLLEEGNELLQPILLNHLILNGNVDSIQILEGGDTIQLGLLPPLMLDVSRGADGSIMIGSATIVMADLFANNGIVHIIDDVLLGDIVLPEVPMEAPAPTEAPVAAPTDAPVMMTDAPVAAPPTDAPITVVVVDLTPPTDMPVAETTDPVDTEGEDGDDEESDVTEEEAETDAEDGDDEESDATEEEPETDGEDGDDEESGATDEEPETDAEDGDEETDVTDEEPETDAEEDDDEGFLQFGLSEDIILIVGVAAVAAFLAAVFLRCVAIVACQ